VTLEDIGDGAEDFVADDHILALPVLGTLGHLELEAALVALVLAHIAMLASIQTID
jgi:hypothetical protein